MSFLVDRRAPALPLAALSDLFDRHLWCMDDNGAAILRTREDWLLSPDRVLVEIALGMDEALPFAHREEMDAAFTQIVSRWPDLHDTCEAIRSRRERSVGKQ